MDNELIDRVVRKAGFRVMDGGSITVWPERGEMPDIDPLVRSLIALVAEEAAKVCADDENGFSVEGKWCAAAIRAKFKESK